MPTVATTGGRRAWFIALVGVAAMAAAAISFFRGPSTANILVVDLPLAKSSGPAMCPWRKPDRDMALFFPGATSYRTDVLALSSIRQRILERMGPAGRLDSLALDVHQVLRQGKVVGSVLVRRAAGPHGAIEVVTAIDQEGKVAGVSIQRQREPEEVARWITSHDWLKSFEGKSAESLVLSPRAPVSPQASEAATTIQKTVRSLLIEFEEAERYYRGPASQHH
jgi:hypothetical protein